METAAESGREELDNHQIQSGRGERAEWLGTGKQNIPREKKISGANGDTPSRIDNRPQFTPILLEVMTANTRDSCTAAKTYGARYRCLCDNAIIRTQQNRHHTRCRKTVGRNYFC